MSISSSNIEIISVHVPKTAGTTFRSLLCQVYNPNQIFCEYPGHSNLKYGTNSITSETKVIHGHFFVRKYAEEFPDAKKIAWVRHPISRLMSHYYYWKTAPKAPIKMKNLTFAEFSETPPMQNRMSRFLRGVKLENFYFLGIQEFFSDDLLELKSKLDWSEIELERSDNRLTSSEYYDFCHQILSNKKLMSHLVDLNQEDMSLYEKALEIRNKRVEGITAVHQFYLDWQRSKLQLHLTHINLEKVDREGE